MFPFPNRDASVHRDWPADVSYVAAKDGARIAEKGELGVALGNDRPLAFIRVQILVKTTVNDKRQKARIPATKLQWLPARHAILTSGSGRTLDGRESLRAGRDAQLLPCRPADRYPGPNAHTGPDGRTSVNQPIPAPACDPPPPGHSNVHCSTVECTGSRLPNEVSGRSHVTGSTGDLESARVVGNLRRPPKTCHSSSESWKNGDSEYVIHYAGKIRPLGFGLW